MKTVQDTPSRILVVDDDEAIRDLLGRFLDRHGLAVCAAADGPSMMAILENQPIDLIVLDLMLPGEDGLSLTQRLRATGVTTPIVMLTAMGEDTDRIVGLEMGADDYVPKPFNPRELLARIKAVLRRFALPMAENGASSLHPSPRHCVRFIGWTLDLSSRDLVNPQGVTVALSAGEFDLLHAFVENPRRVLSRDQLLNMTRGRMTIPFDRSVDIQVSRLRRKLEDDAKEPQLIKTVRGGGYLFTPQVEAL